MTAPTYVPILKGKEGEFGALELLRSSVKTLVIPLVEVPPVPYDFINDRPARSLEEHVSGVAERLSRSWGGEQQLLLDLPWFGDEETLEDGRVALMKVLGDCRSSHLRIVPVVRLASSQEYVRAAGEHAAECSEGVALRLVVEDFSEESDIEQQIERMLDLLGHPSLNVVDVILDLGALAEDDRDIMVARSALSQLPSPGNWRRIVVAGASFPENLSDFEAEERRELPRREWQLWLKLVRKPGLLPKEKLVFGDYAISHPVPQELDPRTMRMSASIRYTTEKGWLVLKGRNVRQYGFDQYFDLARELVASPSYAGREYSWGDNYIAECSERTSGPGNATTWRKVGTNHHITLVADQTANLPAS